MVLDLLQAGFIGHLASIPVMASIGAVAGKLAGFGAVQGALLMLINPAAIAWAFALGAGIYLFSHRRKLGQSLPLEAQFIVEVTNRRYDRRINF